MKNYFNLLLKGIRSPLNGENQKCSLWNMLGTFIQMKLDKGHNIILHGKIMDTLILMRVHTS